MGADPAYLSERWNWRIEQNPVTIEYQRTPQVRNPKGGFMDGPTVNVKLEASYVEPSRLLELEKQMGGAAQVDVDIAGALLLPKAVDPANTNPADSPVGDPPERDEFPIPGRGRFRVRRVRILTWMAEEYGRIAYLERLA